MTPVATHNGVEPLRSAAPTTISVPETDEFERIYREHASLVYRTAWGVLGSREDAEDVLQTVFVKLLRRESLPDLHSHSKAYFYKAAVAASLDSLKARRRRPVLVDDAGRGDAPAFHPSARFDDEIHERLVEAIAQLSPDAAEILLLRYMQNNSLGDIAAALGLSRAAVAVRLFRARARLKSLLLGESR